MEKENAIDLLTADSDGVDSSQIGFRKASFVWSNDVDGSLTPSNRKFVLKIDDDLIFQRGRLICVVGPTGS